MTSHAVQTTTWLEPGSSPTRSKGKRGKATKATDDPFPYGYRWREVRETNGSKHYEQVALTREDFLNPQVDDVMPQGNWHDHFLGPLVDPKRRPFFVAEALSENTKEMDLADKKRDYALAGVEEYFIFNILKDPVEILAFRLVKSQRTYRAIKAGPGGRFVSRTLGLAFRVEPFKRLGIVVEDASTGEVLLTLEEKVELLEKKLEAAERRAAELEAKLRALGLDP